MSSHSSIEAKTPIFHILQDKYDIVLIHNICNMVILPSLMNSRKDTQITLINLGYSDVKILNENHTQHILGGNETMTFLNDGNYNGFWTKINHSINKEYVDNKIADIADVASANAVALQNTIDTTIQNTIENSVQSLITTTVQSTVQGSIRTKVWGRTGNSFNFSGPNEAILKMGTLNDMNWNLIQNNTTIATVGPSTITGLPIPEEPSDVATKDYADTKWSINGSIGRIGRFCKMGTLNDMTWKLIQNDIPIATIGPYTITGLPLPENLSDVATKEYIDRKYEESWSNVGNIGSMGGHNKIGTLNEHAWILIYNNVMIAAIGPSTITGLPMPTQLSDVATKAYVDRCVNDANAANAASAASAASASNNVNSNVNNWKISGNVAFDDAKLGTTNANTWSLLYNNNNIATVGPFTITGLPIPVFDSDVVTKRYVDRKKNCVPLISRLSTNISVSGISVYSSSEFNSSYRAFNAFNSGGINEWATNNETSNCWIEIKLLEPVILYKIVLTGRLGQETVANQMLSYSIIGSNGGTQTETVFSNVEALTSTPKVFDIVYYNTPYKNYRLYCFQSTEGSTMVGLKHWGLYSYIA